MKKNIETVLKTFLSNEQIAVLKEEIISGIRKINAAVDSNEKIKAKKDLMIDTFMKIDELIEKSEKSPLIFKTFYSVAKSNIRKLIQPVVEEMIDDEQIKNLDDIPDVKTPEKKEEKEEPAKKNTEYKNDQKPVSEKRKTVRSGNASKSRPKTAAVQADNRRNFNRKDAGKNSKGR